MAFGPVALCLLYDYGGWWESGNLVEDVIMTNTGIGMNEG